MSSDQALLSSLQTAVEELADRVVAVADRYEGSEHEGVLADLRDAERSLGLAARRLARAGDALA